MQLRSEESGEKKSKGMDQKGNLSFGVYNQRYVGGSVVFKILNCLSL